MLSQKIIETMLYILGVGWIAIVLSIHLYALLNGMILKKSRLFISITLQTLPGILAIAISYL